MLSKFSRPARLAFSRPSRTFRVQVHARLTKHEALRRLGFDPATSPSTSNSAASDERQIKRLYRKAAMKSHPDLGGSEEAFSSIHEAYELLLALSRGKDPWGAHPDSESANQQDGWTYHDWYWHFKMSRGRSPGPHAGTRASHHPNPAAAYNPGKVTSQLEGLRKRAKNRSAKAAAASPVPSPHEAHHTAPPPTHQESEAPAPPPPPAHDVVAAAAPSVAPFDALHSVLQLHIASTVALEEGSEGSTQGHASAPAAPQGREEGAEEGRGGHAAPYDPVDDGNGVTWARAKGAQAGTTRKFLRSSSSLPTQLEGLMRKSRIKRGTATV